MFIFFGDVTEVMINFSVVLYNKTVSEEDFSIAEDTFIEGIRKFGIETSILGFVTVICMYISVVLVNRSSIRQISKLKSIYMESILNKDIAWYDVNQTGDFSSRITEDLGKIEDALSDKLSTFVFYMSTFFSGLIVSLIEGWELSLICLIYLPVSLVAMGLVSWLSGKLVKKEMDAYAAAGAIAEEVLGAIRTVMAFDGQQKEIDRYKECLFVARDNNIRRGLFTAFSNGSMWLFVYGSYALSFFYGIKLIIDEKYLSDEERVYTPGNMITVFFGVLVATWNFGQCAPFFQIFSVAASASGKIFSIIDEPPTVNLSKTSGKKFSSLQGNIKFENIHFNYPSRTDVKILQGLNLNINSGETVALVGSSGCGKSTCIQLIQRFYDPLNGRVTIDGNDMKDLNLRWLRSQIGVVGQEPVLFGTTIEENIRYGNQFATRDEIEEAAKKANAHTFIKNLPQGYETTVGERGAQLSGGQKQRIAIARALVRKPAILLLDEATSALDTNSEAQVQAALDSASKGCTTIIVAHRLSTIRGANRIVVLSEGQVVEEGTHDKLMSLKSAYYKLVTSQISSEVKGNLEENNMTDLDESNNEVSPKLSVISNDIQAEEVLEKDNINMWTTIGEILKLNKPETMHIIIACIGAAISGASLPIYSIVFGDIVGILGDDDTDFVRTEGNKFSMYFAIIGVVTGIAAFFQWYLFGISGEKLTLRVRSKLFETMLKQEIGWYDRKDNGTGALCTKLSADASGVQGASGQTIGTIVNSLSSLGLAIGFSFYFEWRLTLVNLCFVPLIFMAIYFEQKLVNNDTGGSRDAVEKSSKIAVEAISNIRTVASLGCEKIFHTQFLEVLGPHYRKARRGTHLRGIILGMSRSLMFFTYAASIYYGGTLIQNEKLHYSLVFKVCESMIAGAWAVGNALAFAPNLQKGVVSSGKLIRMLRRIPAIRDNQNSTSLSWANSSINYKHIKFNYPTRPGIKVLRDLNLEVLHGKTVALVGPSGCGKSTIIQLLERFYDPSSGAVDIDNQNLKNVKLSSLRKHLGIVSQEPNLFDRTIAENIAYGDNSRIVQQDEIIQAAKNANIHNFITALPQGYETRLGEKGTQLSGGQKQRIAIARALVRNPQVLLLDEATSALDTESEKIVQEALDNAQTGRTCITIAHRLLTIQDADVICVVNKGEVSEMGSHSELLALKGLYHKLYSMQMGHR
ncbi:PREDICTED: multidrug resistance protein 1B-like isoform X2 [Nicrophorus vespilloides]|nr:PREDICTED: multidrug resistance protein 1B-like isoform X2 [Nicrophorus vespilloides]